MSTLLSAIHARQILDSRGNPTVEVDIELNNGAKGRAAVPSGASTGSHEAVELRDGGDLWLGKGVSKAVASVNSEIANELLNTDVSDHAQVDRRMIELDGTKNKGRLGANAILGVSLALARALANANNVSLWSWLRNAYAISVPDVSLPVPMLNVINGGEHANNAIDVQEFMIVPHGFSSFSEGLQAAVRTFHTLKKEIDQRGLSTAVGDEGGFAPNLSSNVEALDLLTIAIERAGFTPGEHISIALDVAATELFTNGKYNFKGDNKELSVEELIDTYTDWLNKAPIVSIEDGVSEDDWDGWKELTHKLGNKIQLVGDDIFVTNPERLQRGINESIANSMLVKVNQIGSLSETISAMNLAYENDYKNVMSHRSGETEDSIIADLAVGTACGQIKTGAPSRSDRVAKYNQLLRIEEELGSNAKYINPFSALAVNVAN